jgi:hypothetical protein
VVTTTTLNAVSDEKASPPIVTQQASTNLNHKSKEVTGSALPSPKNKNLDATLSTTPSTQQVAPLLKSTMTLITATATATAEEKAISSPVVMQQASVDVNDKPGAVTGSPLPQSQKNIKLDETTIPSSESLTVTEKAGTFSDSMDAANEEEKKRQASQTGIFLTPTDVVLTDSSVAVNEANLNATNAPSKEDAQFGLTQHAGEHSTDEEQSDAEVVPLNRDVNALSGIFLRPIYLEDTRLEAEHAKAGEINLSTSSPSVAGMFASSSSSSSTESASSTQSTSEKNEDDKRSRSPSLSETNGGD